jgi:hypothetical protein
MFQSNIALPLNTKVCIIMSLSCYQNLVIFWIMGSELWIFDSQPPNFTPSFMCTRFEFRRILHLVQMAAPNVIHLRIKQFLSLTEILWKVETFSSGLCMQPSFIAVRTYLCARVRVWFWRLSLIPDVRLRIHDRWCAGVDSLELPREGWFSCTFVGHPKGLWVRRVSKVLDTWAHEHKGCFGSTHNFLWEAHWFGS